MGSYERIQVFPGDGTHPPDVTLHFSFIHPGQDHVTMPLEDCYRLAEDLLVAMLNIGLQEGPNPIDQVSPAELLRHVLPATMRLRQTRGDGSGNPMQEVDEEVYRGEPSAPRIAGPCPIGGGLQEWRMVDDES